MKRAWQKKELWLLIGISLLVGSLIHFPELLSLTDAWGNKQLFPDFVTHKIRIL